LCPPDTSLGQRFVGGLAVAGGGQTGGKETRRERGVGEAGDEEGGGEGWLVYGGLGGFLLLAVALDDLCHSLLPISL
jgi:hypothetical protein